MNDLKKKRILIIEDDQHIAEGLKLNLSFQGHEALIVNDGVSSLQKWKELRPDLIVLDIMLPGIDGLSVLESIRLEDEKLPILILSAKGSQEDKIRGLSRGGDDYLSKPFNLEEFLLRVEKLLAKASWYNDGDHLNDSARLFSVSTYSFGNNFIDFEKGTADCICGRITLTSQEVKLLKLFVANRGKPLSRNKLLEIGWGYTKDTCTRTVDNFIVRFRKYFEKNPKKPKFFKSIRSMGYMFDHDPD